MRLVCEQCSAGYTIEDELVGERDFRVSCKQCGTPIVVKHERETGRIVPGQQITAEDGPPSGPVASRPPRPPASFAPTGEEEWFVWIGESQTGPMPAAQVALLIEQGDMDWGTQVWRDGFKDWRAARRDATLVTAVAGARGGAGDTMRLNAARSFLAPEDTIVEARPDFAAYAQQRISITGESDLLTSGSDTQALDARDLPQPEPQTELAPAPNAAGGSNPPSQWNSPENAAFRAGLGLPSDTQSVRRSTRPSHRAPTMGDAFRSPPSLLRSQPANPDSATDPAVAEEARETWLPKPQSLLVVAALAFAGGVVAAALVSKVLVKPKAETQAQAAEADSELAAQAPEPQVTPAAEPPKAPEPTTLAPVMAPSMAEPTRDLPEQDELRREVRRVAPQVKRCILDPIAGVDVGVFIEGPTGRVRDVDVRSAGLTPGRVDCVIQAVRQVTVPPFRRSEVKLEHRFSW